MLSTSLDLVNQEQSTLSPLLRVESGQSLPLLYHDTLLMTELCE